jgi:hypothetical protein
MNFVPRPQPQPEPEPERPWLASIAVGAMVALCIGALVAHVLKGSNAFQILREFAGSKKQISAGVVEQYTRFRTEKIEGGEVVTGFEYAKSTDPAPRSQYCYLMMHRDAGLGLRVTLGAKLPDSVAPIYPPIASEVAGQLGLAADQAAKLARERCHFDRWE